LAKTTYFNFFSPFLEVGYCKFFGVEFWLTITLIFFKKFNLEKTTYLSSFFSSLFRSWLLQILLGLLNFGEISSKN